MGKLKKVPQLPVKPITTALKKNRLAVNLMFFINGFMFSSWAARIPKIQSQFNLDNSDLGTILLMAALGSLFAMPFTGWLISKMGSKKITTISSFLFVLAVPLFSLSPNALILGGTFLFMGVATGTMDVAMNAQSIYVEEKYKRPIISFFHGLFSAGMMVGAGVSALYSKVDISLTIHFTSLLLLNVPILIWAINHLVNDTPDKKEMKGETFFHIPNKNLVGIGVIAFCCMLGEGAMSDWSAAYMEQIIKSKKILFPFGLFAFSLAMMLGRFRGDHYRALWGDRKLIQVGSIIALIGIIIILFLTYPAFALLGFFLVGLGLSTIVPIAYSTAGSLPGLAPGVGIGMVTTIGYTGFLFGPPIIGFLADWSNLRMAMVFVLMLFISMTIIGHFNKQLNKSKL